MGKKGGASYAALIALLVFMACFGIFRGTDLRIQDSVYQRLSVVSPDIYVVGIDEETLEALGPFQSWGRDITAEIIEKLTGDPDTAPAVIGVDIGFYGHRGEYEDNRLVEAVKNAGDTKIVFSSFASFGGTIVQGEDGFYLSTKVKTFEEPFDELKEVSISGHANVIPDEDGIIRHALNSIESGGEARESFAYEIYKAYTGEEPSVPREENSWYIAYSGKPMDYYGAQGVGSSFIRVLNGEYPNEIFAGSVVLIGAYSSGLLDSYYTPVSRDIQMNGVEIHANILQAMLDENYKISAGTGITVLIMLFMAAAVTLLTKKFEFRVSGAFTAVLTAAYLFAANYIYKNGFVLSILYPLLAMWLPYIFRCFYSYWRERMERRKMMEIFSRYLSPQIAKNIEVRGENALVLGGLKKHIAVLFVDIRGFTTISEALAPEEVVEFLNHYLNLTTKSIFDNDGTVDKFIGDATMAVFNAPFDLDDYVFKAVKTGLDMVEGAKLLEKELTAAGGKKVGFGVGINCGDAVVGNIGTSFRMEYTAIGDTVNTASRLEGQAKAGEVIISEEVYKRLEGRIDAECLGARQLKGKADGFIVYRVNGLIKNEEAEKDGDEN